MAKRSSYHHGDLRRVLLDASLALVNEAGVGALSLREVARKAGVSHNAPYHHFPDKSSVLSAIALEGLTRLTDQMVAAVQAAGQDPKARLEACGLAYVNFAITNAAHFRVMFRPELACHDGDPVLQEASEKPFEQVVAAVMACQEAGLMPAGDPLPWVLTCWSSVHGLASLWIDGPLSNDPKGFGKSPEKLAEIVVFTLSGLLLQPARAAAKAPRQTKVSPRVAEPRRTRRAERV